MSQCTAKSKSSGDRCRQSSIHGGSVCRYHGGNAGQVKAAAQNRILAAADTTAAVLLAIAHDPKMPPAVRVTACKDLLDRAGLKPVEQVEVTTVDSDVVDLEIRRLLRELDKL